jgi:hypothetical protein
MRLFLDLSNLQALEGHFCKFGGSRSCSFPPFPKALTNINHTHLEEAPLKPFFGNIFYEVIRPPKFVLTSSSQGLK